MAKTVIGLFDEPAEVDRAIREIADSGFPRESVSIVANQSVNEFPARATTATEAHTPVASGAGAGATAGALMGGLGGLLLGLGLLAIPGLGPIAAAGPIVAALTGAGAGAVAGGVLGALVNLGVPREEAEYYAEGVRRGGTVIALPTPDDRADEAVRIMLRNGAVDIKQRVAEWRERGWAGYDPSRPPLTAAEAAQERQSYRPLATSAPQPVTAHQDRTRGAAVLSPDPGMRSRALPADNGFDNYEPRFRRDFETTLANVGQDYETHVPAYRLGYWLATEEHPGASDWSAVEPEARTYWEERNPGTWERFRRAVQYAWETVRGD